MTTREALESLPTKELHDRAMEVARHRLDVGFLWRLLEALPVAEEAIGDEPRSKIDIMRPLALVNDFLEAGDGKLVERKRWIGEGRFLHALAFCMLLPGPEAQQLAIYVGWLLHKVRGGIAAGTLFVLPSVGL